MRRKLFALVLALWLAAALPVAAFAQGFDSTRRGSLSITLQTQTNKTPVEGVMFSVYHLATVGLSGENELIYAYTEDFALCDIPLDDPNFTARMEAYVSIRSLPSITLITDINGQASCSDLPLGLYFVQQTGMVPGFSACASFLVTIPGQTGSGYEYNINAAPKTTIERLTDITVKKVWNTDKSTPVPSSITVQLRRGDVVVETAVLNSANNWQVTFTEMPESDDYTVVEVNVPKGYTATYAQSGYVFTVTNSAALAQTGQLVWPIPVLAMAGLVLIAAGTILLRKSREYDA